MSYRHVVYQPQAVDLHMQHARRQPSNASSVSSAYTTSSAQHPLSRTSTLSSAASSNYQQNNHKHMPSEGKELPIHAMLERFSIARDEHIHQNIRDSSRPLPQSPMSRLHTSLPESSRSLPRSPASSPTRHGEGAGFDGKPYNDVDEGTSRLNPSTPVGDFSALLLASSSNPVNNFHTGYRNQSPTRSPYPHQVEQIMHTPLSTPDLRSLEKSPTKHFRTLSKLVQDAGPDDFAVQSSAQEVTGLHGRRKLQKTSANRNGGVQDGSARYGWDRNWMDKQRQYLQAYEYLCHIGEAKEWIEDIISKPIPPIVQLEETLRDGVILAELVEALHPERRIRIFRNPKLQYRHSDNANIFFQFLVEVELPDLFRFELIDLYDKKNIPKVIHCIHALSWLLYRQGAVDFRIGNLVGQLQFEDHELENMQKGLEKTGVSMPSFGNMGAAFGIADVEPEPEHVESEDDRIERELRENEHAIQDLQAQIRGALTRMELGRKMQSLWDAEELLIDMQSRIRGDQARQVAAYHLGRRQFATNIQSSARGFLSRRRLQDAEVLWRNSAGEVVKLQSLIRAGQSRSTADQVRTQLIMQNVSICRFQALVRGCLHRGHAELQAKQTGDQSAQIKLLQSAVRGMISRKSVSDDIILLRRREGSVLALQSLVRRVLYTQRMSRQHECLSASENSWAAIQAFARGAARRASVVADMAELRNCSNSIVQLQGVIRGGVVRCRMSLLRNELCKETSLIDTFQGYLRGAILRRSLADENRILLNDSATTVQLQSMSRALHIRRRDWALKQALAAEESSVVEFQGLARAVLLRLNIGEMIDQLEFEELPIIELQSIVRAGLVRARFVEKQKFFKANMEKVVKIQSFVRGRLQGEAYKSLTTGKNPPVNTVKNFVHLLNDSDFDFNEEIEFERLRKGVVQQVRQNELAEDYISQLDIKIALLVKNKITLDDVMQHQRTYGSHGNMYSSASMSPGNQFDLKALNKNSRKKLELYQQLFFMLQTQPQYLARLFKKIREQGLADNECKRVETLMMGLFGYAQKRREEYYLLKLVSRAIKEEVEHCDTLQDFLRANFFWTKLLSNYTRSPRDRKYLRELLGPVLRDNIIEDATLDLETDPMQIYRSCINNEELRTGQPSHRPLDVPREVAIMDKETRKLFVDHLTDLREVSDLVLIALEDLVHKMPYGVRFIAQQMFESLCEHFPREPQQHLLRTTGQWLWRFYVQSALINPEQVGVIEKQLTPLQKRNLAEINKVISQAMSGKLFGGDNIHSQPLNSFLGSAIERINIITSNLISVPDAESTFDIDEFNDLYAKTKPTLYIKMADIFAIHNLVSSDLLILCPSRDDTLREIVQELGSAKSNETEMLAGSSAEIQMTLTPKLHDIDDPEADVKALFMETKRCILYIIRIQSGPNLMDILVRPISEDDTQKWKALLKEEFGSQQNSRGAYSDINSMVDIRMMSYAELKRTALENVMRLEQMGRVSRQNYFQDLLNAIAVDIRTKSRRRVDRQRELDGVRLTLSNLDEKAEWLEQQRKSYDNYIEQAMMTLQNKKGRKKFLLPFTKQYNHERELEKSGRKPKFGSFKYSARTLADKGVLVSWQGYSDRQWDKINVTFSCDQVGVFSVEGSMGSIQIPGASAQVPLDSILEAQFAASTYMVIFEGQLKLNVNLFLHLIYKKFYRTE